MLKNPHTISLKPEPPQQEIVAPPRETPPRSAPESRRRRRRMFLLAEYGVYAIILASIAGGVYVWMSWDDWSGDAAGAPAQNAEETQEEINDLVAAVGELIVLPEGEEPTIATVTDPEKLRDQVFFANAKEGDVVLIYTRAQKAYLYDPRIDKLLEVAPLTIQ